MVTADSFDATHLQRRYYFLSDIPETIYAELVTHPHGRLAERVKGVLTWRNHLLRGLLPSSGAVGWPARELAEAYLTELENLGVARFCKGEAKLVDEILKDLLEFSERYEAAVGASVVNHFTELERLEKLKRVKARASQPRPAGSSDTEERETSDKTLRSGAGSMDAGQEVPQILDEATRAMLAQEARRLAENEQSKQLAQELAKRWVELARFWADLADVFGELGELTGRGWDLARGLLATAGWKEILRLRRLVEKIPQLKEIVRALGRLQEGGEGTSSTSKRIFEKLRRAGEETRRIVSPFAPTEARGVDRSDEISRMLPSEAVLLSRPILKTLWHAKRAERTLLTYKVEGVLPERISGEGDIYSEVERIELVKLERGPILICLDTSGSMSGVPETVAKALALEAVRVAFAEKRRCYLYLFSGPGQIIEHDLKLSEDGLSTLLEFLVQSFEGGTDVTGPLKKATEKLDEHEWGKADLMIVTDGEFPLGETTRLHIHQAREKHGLRVHSVLIGSRDTDPLKSVSNFVHVFTDWASVCEPVRGHELVIDKP